MVYFSGRDLRLIESLTYEPTSEPSYDLIKDALIWDDERPHGLTPDGYEKLCDLWIARSFLHKRIPFSSWKLDPIFFENVWSEAIEQGFSWPGFNRLELSEKDKQYYEIQRADAMNSSY
jgi:hypothetical protein